MYRFFLTIKSSKEVEDLIARLLFISNKAILKKTQKFHFPNHNLFLKKHTLYLLVLIDICALYIKDCAILHLKISETGYFFA
ncbi:hypothetical protein AL469_023010 [Vibrio harveyi]|nr:hypothetical protein AL469_023010 [Vibrio harveyi]